jgi:hypothetical protein
MPKRHGNSNGHIYLKVRVAVSDAEQRVLMESNERMAALFGYTHVAKSGAWAGTKAL